MNTKNISTKSRKNLRLKYYDYSQSGLYFITVCAYNKRCIFGKIKSEKMLPNKFGKIIEKYWLELENRFSNIFVHEYIVVPNHLHGIMEIGKNNVGAPFVGAQQKRTTTRVVPTTVSNAVGAFKSLTANEYIRNVKNGIFPPFEKQIWQRSFYEHVIRNELSLNKIKEYIEINPKEWHKDRNNPIFNNNKT